MVGVLLLLVIFAPVEGLLRTPTVAVVHAQTPPASPSSTTGGLGNGVANAGGGGDISCSLTNVSLCISAIIYVFAVSLPNGFAYITSYVFNFGIQLALNSGSYAINFLTQGWAIVRDIANLSFIFILIYIAYTIMVEAETSGTMKALAAVIVMALLINFSFFITRVVVDAGNLLAVQFYNAICIGTSCPNGASPVVASPLGGSLNQPAVKDLSTGIMNALQVQTLLSSQAFIAYTQSNGFLTNLGTQVLIYIAVGVFLFLIGFIFLMMGVKFLVRIIILWFAIIASPLAFAAHALPGNKQVMGYYKLWEKHLVQSAFYPAVFLFLFYIITLLMNALAGANGLIASAFNPNTTPTGTVAVPGFVTIIANVGVRLGLIVVLLYYAMKFSDSFSEESSNAARSIVSWAGNKTAGASGWAARNTLGRGANAAARSSRVQDFAANSVFGRPVMASLKGIAGSSLDFRGAPGLQSIAKSNGVTLNKPPKTSFEKQVATRAKNVEDRAKELKGDSYAIAKEQKAYQADYDDKNGDGSYARKVAELSAAKAAAEKESELLKRAGNNEGSKAAKKEANKLGAELKTETEAGKRKVEKLSDERKQRYADRLGSNYWANAFIGPSRGTVEGIAKVRGSNKSEKDKAIEHLEHIIKHPDGEGDDDHDPDGHDGGPKGTKKAPEKEHHDDTGHEKTSDAGDHSHEHKTSSTSQIESSLSKEDRTKLKSDMREVVAEALGNRAANLGAVGDNIKQFPQRPQTQRNDIEEEPPRMAA